MFIYVTCSFDILMAQNLLCYLDIHALSHQILYKEMEIMAFLLYWILLYWILRIFKFRPQAFDYIVCMGKNPSTN